MSELKISKRIVSILPLILFSIILPTLDVGSDISLISRLYTGSWGCLGNDYRSCLQTGADIYCRNSSSNLDLCQRFEDGEYSCYLSDDYWTCYDLGATWYCNSPNANKDICHEYDDGGFYCYFSSSQEYWSCRQDPTKYCSNSSTNHAVCHYGHHPMYASSLLLVFLINYIISMITWARKYQNDCEIHWNFIFPLLNWYQQYGEYPYCQAQRFNVFYRGIQSDENIMEEPQ